MNFFSSYHSVVHILEVAGALTHDLFITISFPQGEGPHVQPPIVLLRCADVSWGSCPLDNCPPIRASSTAS